MSEPRPIERPRRTARRRLFAAAALGYLALACAVQGVVSDEGPRHGWWEARGPVVPHDSFPADCSLCHQGSNWQDLRDDFQFDHEGETGVRLDGAHTQARCLRCHNDRGPVANFARRGCAGCHEDIHFGELGPDCTKCHQENTWEPFDPYRLHLGTRFPLVGVHATTACFRCHQGFEVGQFLPADTECVTCHQDDLARANNPPHLTLGFVERCDRCHLPTNWNQAQVR